MTKLKAVQANNRINVERAKVAARKINPGTTNMMDPEKINSMTKNKTPRRRSFGTISKAKVYPVIDSRKTVVSDLATVGFSASAEQAVALARMLLIAAHDCDGKRIDVTAFRKTNLVSVTAAIPSDRR
jgi:hypothetical protein